MSVHQTLDASLRRLEAAMKAADLWRVREPEAQAFESRQPFCIDTMELPQWLRFVFIPRLDALIDAKAPLPSRCDVAPAAHVYLKQIHAKPSQFLLVVRAIEEVDRTITQAD
ncbi:YqcC family protein [Pistricoccus aurantiacus]|uniref:YqcC family protein n=1 Tax=Pistricoccus aurantiacus TaxID=1883414 RepID=A0A5B8SVK2_9GAMM|nr:YqcC family protein [Pistricoccus aurantiacus]QEA40471.1 YqcC family protein [Pistricoccus aurantiacus]